MSEFLKYNDPLKVIWRKGDSTDPFPPLSDTQKIINNTVLLKEIPDEFNRVVINGYSEITNGEPTSTQFKVDYRFGIVFFNSSEEGKTVKVDYFGRGQILHPASRVYIHNENPDVVEILQDLVDDGKHAIDALGGLANAIDTAQTLEVELNNDIATGNVLHTTLQSDISQGNSLKNELETSTIPNSETAKSNLENTIDLAGIANITLEDTIGEANTSNTNLNNSIITANTIKTDLDGSISTGDTLKTNLDASISNANNINEILINPDTGTIKQANDINTTLEGTIQTADTKNTELGTTIINANNAKTELENTIIDADLDNYIVKTEKGVANGVATLDETGNVPASQLNNVAGVPKLNVYEYKMIGEVGQTEFTIPLETFDVNTDTVKLYINTTFKDSDYYTISGNKLILVNPLTKVSKVVVEIWKNIPMGAEGSVSGNVLAPNTVDDTKIGERTIDDTIVPTTSNSGLIGNIFNWFANRIKTITGKTSWKDAPTKNMEELNTDIGSLNTNVNALDTEIGNIGNTVNAHLAEITQVPTANKIPKALQTGKLDIGWIGTSSNITYFIDGVNGNNANNGLTEGTAFKTIQYAIDKLPKLINHVVVINVMPGTYDEEVRIFGFYGDGALNIYGDTVISETRKVRRFYVRGCRLDTLNIKGFNMTFAGGRCIDVWNTQIATLQFIKCTQPASYDGISFQTTSTGVLLDSEISNRTKHGLYCVGSIVRSSRNTGTGNGTALRSISSIIFKDGSQPIGSVNEETTWGGLIL